MSFTGSLRIYIALDPCDLRKSFNGLQAAVSEQLQEDPLSGALFVFTNRRRNRIKILYWDGSGLWVLAKRLEEGTFRWPKGTEADSNKIKLAPEAFAMLTDGIDLRDGARRAWYERE